MRRPGGEVWGALDTGLAVMESKSARGLALAARELHALGARRQQTMSEYCLSVLLVQARPRQRAAAGAAALPSLPA
jgi:hypothetical protein